HQDRHPAEKGISGCRHEIGGAGAERREADAGLAGMAAVSRRHEARALLMPGQDQADLLRSAETVEQVEILFAGDAENIFDAFFLQALDEKVGRLGCHAAPPLLRARWRKAGVRVCNVPATLLFYVRLATAFSRPAIGRFTTESCQS